MMARNAPSTFNQSTNAVVKLQAAVRGIIVRKRFEKLKQEYKLILQSFEGDNVQLLWKNHSRLSLPILQCTFKKKGEQTKDISTVKHATSHSTPVRKENKTQSCPSEIVNKNCHNFILNDNEIENKYRCFSLDEVEVFGKDKFNVPVERNMTTVHVQPMKCSSKITFVSLEDSTVYPHDKISLLELRKDLSMELLWINQAIESRISVRIIHQGI
ncbi:uncharacterized protein LOC124455188 isoform X2 [Xenia sp. Carnegie-2017]|uniref:uncharacterized protein LOC124455188 isoform X2 n=1 Tax=Xenia sp. Carnegie-2017 TaxID=2897299 RepID=UPI001F03815E|nr:uncharacterized protein LOC124455188 isoform X2 [Xenia sp. Carnegie-2017]